MVTSVKVRVKALQLSEAVAVAKEGTEEQSMVEAAGSGSITGAVISCTLIVCEAEEEFPQSSVAVHVRVTEYDPAQAPGVVASVKVRVKALQLSVAVAVAKEGMPEQSMVEAAGNGSMTGAVIS